MPQDPAIQAMNNLVGGRVVRWCWVNFQCWGVLPFRLQFRGQRPTALAAGAGWGCLDIFTLIYPFSLSLVDGPI